MDTITSPPLSPLPTPQPPLPVPEPPVELIAQTKSSKGILITLAVMIVLAVSAYFAYPYLSSYLLTAPDTSLPPASSTPVATPVQAYPPIENAKNHLVYLRNPDPLKHATNYQAWIIDPNTSVEEQLPLKGFVQAYKYYGSPLLFYKPVGDQAEYRILDLTTGIEQSYTLITHPDPGVKESTNINNLTEISPDAKYLVFQADFFTICPSPSPFPSGFEGGFGPCQPDESLDTPWGTYLYDFETRKATHLDDFFRVSRWDTANHKLYYITESATKAIDLVNKTITPVDSTSHFGYYTYPLFASHQLVKNEGATGNSGDPAFSKITLLDLATQKSTEIDSAGDWAEIQPFITSSPDEQIIIYIRTNLVGDGIRRSDLYRYNLVDHKSSRLTPENNLVSYSIYGDWLDNNTFVTSADEVETTNYTNANKYLVKIDLDSGELTRLTPHDKVYLFNTQ